MNAQAIFFTDVHQVTVGEVEIPNPRPGEVLVQALYSCISPGTELRCLAGKQPNAQPFPFIPGYALVGEIIDANGTGLEEGTIVFCGSTSRADRAMMWGGHVSLAVRPASDVIPIPSQVNPLDAAAAKIASIAYHGVRHSRPQPHETVIVVGLGVIGQMSARLHALSGARVLAFDLSPARVEIANRFGVEAHVATSIIEQVRILAPNGADVIVDATGAPQMVAQLIELAKDIPWNDSLTPGARFVVQGSYPTDFAIPYQAAFMKEITFYIPRDMQRRDYVAVIDLIARGKLEVCDLVTQVYAPNDAPEAYDRLRKSELITAAIQWNGS